MSKIIIITICISVVALTSCSSTYTIGNFTSKQKFYTDFNNFERNKDLKITLLTDSVFYSNSEIQIFNDTLFTIKQFIEKRYNTIPIKQIKKIDYLSSDYKTANFLLLNGKLIKAVNIQMRPDSINFYVPQTIIRRNVFLPIDKVKTISYKNHWLGFIPGIPTGALIGFITGVLGFYPTHTSHPDMGTSNETQSTDLAGSAVIGTGIGTIIGGVLGWVIGFNYTYQFNP